MARDVLHDWDGALRYQCDRHRVGAHAVARGPGGDSVAQIYGQRSDGVVIKEPSAVLMAIHAELLKGASPVMSKEK